MTDFYPHRWGYTTSSELLDVQFSESNDAARYRITRYSTVFYGRWQPIRYNKHGRPYIRDWHGNVAKGKPSRKYKVLYLDTLRGVVIYKK